MDKLKVNEFRLICSLQSLSIEFTLQTPEFRHAYSVAASDRVFLLRLRCNKWLVRPWCCFTRKYENELSNKSNQFILRRVSFFHCLLDQRFAFCTCECHSANIRSGMQHEIAFQNWYSIKSPLTSVELSGMYAPSRPFYYCCECYSIHLYPGLLKEITS